MKIHLCKTLFVKWLLGALALFLIAQPAWAQTKPQKIQVPSQMPAGHPISVVMDRFCETVSQGSGGRLALSHFPSGQLLTDREIPKAISRGTVKIAQTYLPWWSGMIPDIFPSGGRQVESYAHYRRLSDGPLGDYWARRLSEKGRTQIIAPLLYGITAGYILNRDVQASAPLKGMKIRIPSKVLAAEVQALGGTPTVLSSADVYMALQRGTIQGAMSGIGSFFSRKWYEVAKSILILRPMPSEHHIVVNRKWFNTLPPDLRQLVENAGKAASAACAGMIRAREKEYRAGLAAKGVSIVEVSEADYRSRFAPVVEPALRAYAVAEFGPALADQWDAWIEATR